MAKRTSFREEAVVPKTMEDAAAALVELKTAYLAAESLEQDLNAMVDSLVAAARAKVEPMNQRMQSLLAGLRIFATANRSTYARGKTIDLPTGKLFWRSSSTLVVENTEAVIAAIEDLGKGESLLKKIVKLDRRALREDKDALARLPGVSIRSGESFYVKPDGVDVEFPRRGRKGRKKEPFTLAS